MKWLVRMDVRKIYGLDKISQMFGLFAISHSLLQTVQADDTHHTSFIGHRPGMKFSIVRSVESLPHGRVRAHDHSSRAHCLSHEVLAVAQTCLRAWQMNAILYRQRFVDGLPLHSGRDEEADHIRNH